MAKTQRTRDSQLRGRRVEGEVIVEQLFSRTAGPRGMACSTETTSL
jgi:hypothetical protein